MRLVAISPRINNYRLFSSAFHAGLIKRASQLSYWKRDCGEVTLGKMNCVYNPKEEATYRLHETHPETAPPTTSFPLLCHSQVL